MSLAWYAIQTYSGSELSVKKAIENMIKDFHLENKIQRVLVPTEDIIDIKKGKKNIIEQSLYQGYVFVYVDLDTELWHKIQSLPKIGRFIGESKKPTPLSNDDIKLILQKAENRAAPKPKISFSEGESVRIIDGPFANFTGNVEEYDMEHKKLKLNVLIFGRSTPVEISYSQVEKISY